MASALPSGAGCTSRDRSARGVTSTCSPAANGRLLRRSVPSYETRAWVRQDSSIAGLSRAAGLKEASYPHKVCDIVDGYGAVGHQCHLPRARWQQLSCSAPSRTRREAASGTAFLYINGCITRSEPSQRDVVAPSQCQRRVASTRLIHQNFQAESLLV
jgi:hypothetical protein